MSDDPIDFDDDLTLAADGDQVAELRARAEELRSGPVGSSPTAPNRTTSSDRIGSGFAEWVKPDADSSPNSVGPAAPATQAGRAAAPPEPSSRPPSVRVTATAPRPSASVPRPGPDRAADSTSLVTGIAPPVPGASRDPFGAAGPKRTSVQTRLPAALIGAAVIALILLVAVVALVLYRFGR